VEALPKGVVGESELGGDRVDLDLVALGVGDGLEQPGVGAADHASAQCPGEDGPQLLSGAGVGVVEAAGVVLEGFQGGGSQRRVGRVGLFEGVAVSLDAAVAVEGVQARFPVDAAAAGAGMAAVVGVG
jgi:hypothetical protein